MCRLSCLFNHKRVNREKGLGLRRAAVPLILIQGHLLSWCCVYIHLFILMYSTHVKLSSPKVCLYKYIIIKYFFANLNYNVNVLPSLWFWAEDPLITNVSESFRNSPYPLWLPSCIYSTGMSYLPLFLSFLFPPGLLLPQPPSIPPSLLHSLPPTKAVGLTSATVIAWGSASFFTLNTQCLPFHVNIYTATSCCFIFFYRQCSFFCVCFFCCRRLSLSSHALSHSYSDADYITWCSCTFIFFWE